MIALRAAFAKLRHPLGALALLVALGAAAGALFLASLPWLPGDAQRRALEGLAWLPGLHAGLEVDAEAPEGRGVLRLEGTGTLAAVHPPPGADWEAAGGASVRLAGVAFLAAWGAALGLLAHVVWFVDSARRGLGLALVFGVASGLLLAHSLEPLPRHWASAWLRGLAGLPGVEERVGSAVGAGGAPSSAHLVSSGGLVATYPPGPPPWPTGSRVEVTGRGRAWFAAYGVLAALGVALVAGGVRCSRWRRRVPLLGLGLALVVWLALPFLPRTVGAAWTAVLGGPGEGAAATLGPLLLVGPTRLGHEVGLGLLVLLAAGLTLALTPVGAVAGGLEAWLARRRASRERGRSEAERARLEPEPLELKSDEPVADDDLPEWLARYEERRTGTRETAAATAATRPPADDAGDE
jgi:hypothetical protein